MHMPGKLHRLLLVVVISLLTSGVQTFPSKEEEADLGDLVQYRDGDILVSVFIPVTDHDETGKCSRDFLSFNMVEQINMLVEKVNADDSILRGMKLGTIMINTCFSGGHSLKKLFMDVLKTYVLGLNCTEGFCTAGKRILAGVVGASRSAVSMDLAKVLQVFSIPQVSYWSTNNELSDKSVYKYFFRTVPSDSEQTLAMTKLIIKMKWNYVSVVYDDDAYGVRGYAELVKQLKAVDVCVAVALPYPENTTDEEAERLVKILVSKQRSRAVVVFSHRSVVGKILFASTKVNGGQNLTWIASDAWSAIMPVHPNDTSYVDSLHGTLGFSLKFPNVEHADKRIRNLTIQDYRGENATLNPWWTEYVKSVKECTLDEGDAIKRLCEKTENVSDFTGIKNDVEAAFQVFVEAIDAYHRDICNNQSGVCKELAKTAGTNIAACALYEYVKNVSFTLSDGATFKFDEKQDGPPVYDIYTFDKNSITTHSVLDGWKKIGIYEEEEVKWNGSLLAKTNETKSTCTDPCKQGHAMITGEQTCCWFCLKCTNRQYVGNDSCKNCSEEEMPNADQSGCIPIEIQQMEYSSGYSIGSISLGVFGLVCTSVITILYLRNRNTAIVRASGRELCFFVLIGVFITLLNCFTITAEPSAVSCGATRVILAIGPSFMYAGLLMKTFRVVFIFQAKGILSVRTKAYLEPVPLIFLTLCVVSVQIVVILAWMLSHPPEAHVKYFLDDNTAFRSCKNLLDLQIFVGLAYPFLIIIFCTILATINRNVPTGFRETLFVGFTMYTTCVTWIAFLPLFFTIPKDIPRQLTTLSIALSVSALTVLFCLFGPRCYTMLRHPEENTAESVMSKNGTNLTPSPRQPAKPISLAGISNPACSKSTSNG